MIYDVVIVGGGPAGLSAALTLGRARKRVLLCDAGTPRNAAAEQIHGFVTRDGTPPPEFRRIAREQLTPYESVEVRAVRVHEITGARGAFRITLDSEVVIARRVILCVGMIDDLPPIPGYRELWGKSIFQCPYCHAWEVRDRPFGVLAKNVAYLDFALLLTNWTRDVVVFTNGAFAVPREAQVRLAAAGIPIEEGVIGALTTHHDHLATVELTDGRSVPREVLFAAPTQRQSALVQSLGLALDEQGCVRVNDFKETSLPGLYAAGDATTMLQSALMAAAAGAVAAAMLNHALTLDSFGVSHPPTGGSGR